MTKSKIEWTEATWNPVTGCTKLSDGCTNCYAANFARRLQAMGNKRYKNGFEVTVHQDLISEPKNGKIPKKFLLTRCPICFMRMFLMKLYFRYSKL